ncbi:unnamed protein product [Phytomonas sp. Hart1]|nr:unnamed protein product [Phytomonas sp. Hart1]|eukprot:CCW69526.1 unnamed protein product [Phytomonas sp. isolate Hart1]
MSTAIQTIGGKQIIRLGSPLVVGIRVQGTIGYSSLDSPHAVHIKPRPYLRYLADTLRNLHCDVSLLFNPIGMCCMEQDYHPIKQFTQGHFPLPFRCLFDEKNPNNLSSNNRFKLTSRNYNDYFRLVCQEAQTNPGRVIVIDSEINYRYTSPQVLIVEAFEPRRKRQVRGSGGGSPTLENLPLSSQQRRRETFQAGITHILSDIETNTSALQREGDQERKKCGEDYDKIRRYFEEKGSSPMVPNRSASSNHFLSSLREKSELDNGGGVVERRIESKKLNYMSRVRELFKSKTPLATDSIDFDWKPSTKVTHYKEGEETNGSDTTNKNYSEHVQKEKERLSSSSFDISTMTNLAINKEDFTLVALAEIITELAASESSVIDYFKKEVLVEKINVPAHGIINYLPIENCDYINMLDWEQVRVEERQRNEGNEMPEVQEREEHKDLFK